MDRPEVRDYGLTEAEVSRWKAWEDKRLTTWMLRLWGCIILATAVIGYHDGGIAIALVYAVGSGFGLGLFGSLVVGAMLPAALAHVIPQLRASRRYAADLQVYERWEETSRTEYWQSLSGLQFEHAVAGSFRSIGYSVVVTPPSGDHGIDLIIARGQTSAVVQCKATRAAAAPAVLRELYGAMVAADAQTGILVSLGGASPGARQFAAGKPIFIMGLTELLAMREGYDPLRALAARNLAAGPG